MEEREPSPDATWLAAAIGDDPARVAADLELGDQRRDFVFRELVEAGYRGPLLLGFLMRLTGIDEREARTLIDAEERGRPDPGAPLAPRDAGLAQNEIAFRERNEVVAHLGRRDAAPAQIEIVCECSDRDCTRSLPMAFSEYEWLRQNPLRFVVLPGHEAPAVEDVVERQQGYVIVEKHSPSHRQVEATDPRAPRRVR
jgi:hypothetical protein